MILWSALDVLCCPGSVLEGGIMGIFRRQQQADEAQSYYAASMKRVASTPCPEGQKYPPGTRVYIAKDLGPGMWHFSKGQWATVHHTYAHAFGGDNIESYCLTLDRGGRTSWYMEWQLTTEEPKP